MSRHHLASLTLLSAVALIGVFTTSALRGGSVAVTSPEARVIVETASLEPLEASVSLEPAAVTVTPPTAGRWIDVDVTHFTVHLMRGREVLRTIEPVAVGAQIDTGAYESTQTGLFGVYSKTAGLTYDAPYRTYIDWWVGFDADKDNGFHTYLLDANGAVVDASTGRVSNGCIRTGEAQAIFDFAEIGMPVVVHI